MTTATTECLHVRANHGPLLNVIGDHQRIILTGEQTGGTMTLLANCNSPGTGIPLHFHGSEDEAFYILEGEVEFTVADQTIIARKGDTIFGARKIPHAWKVIGDRDARMLVFVTPGGCDRMFQELADLCRGGQRPAPETIMEICGRYDVHFQPPV